jgi:glycosyltransferase involved in cell wall biosynthesis
MPQSQAYLRDLQAVGAEVLVMNIRGRPWRVFHQLIRQIRVLRPEIVETHFVKTYVRLAVPYIARALGVKKSIAYIRSMPSKHKYGLRRLLYLKYDQIFTVSQAIADYLIKKGVSPGLIRVHYWGLLGERRRSDELRQSFREEAGIPPQAVVLGNIAFDTPFKGLDILLKAFASLDESFDQTHLMIIGVEPDRSDLPGLAAQLGIGDRVHWAGIRDQGWRLLNVADIYAQSSRFAEGLSMALIEAMALGLPIVGTNVSGTDEAVVQGETGIIVKPGSVAALTAGMERMLANPDEWSTMGRAGHQRYLDMFNGEDSVRRLAEIYFGQ